MFNWKGVKDMGYRDTKSYNVARKNKIEKERKWGWVWVLG